MYASWMAPGRNHLYWGAEVRGPHIVDLAEVLMVFHDSFSDRPLWGVMPIIAKFAAVYHSCSFDVTHLHALSIFHEQMLLFVAVH